MEASSIWKSFRNVFDRNSRAEAREPSAASKLRGRISRGSALIRARNLRTSHVSTFSAADERDTRDRSWIWNLIFANSILSRSALLRGAR